MMPADCIEAELCGILTIAIQFRCHKLNTMINSYTSRDLQNIFPPLVDAIFNSRGGQGWGLRTITQTSNDFELLHEFFSPLGPFLRLCYKLLDDDVKFILPVSYLPHLMKARLMMGDDLPNFYKESLTQDTTGLILQLNAFDYYIFNFALHMCNDLPCTDLEEGQESYSVYRALCCDYLQHFLRSDGNSTVLPDLTILRDHHVKIQTLPTPRSVQTPRLIRISENSQSLPLSPSYANNVSSFNQQHWRTETVLHVFTDVWLCSDIAIESKNTSGLFATENNNNTLPSTDYIRLIRIVVKQFHAFALSAKYDPNPGFVQLKNSTWKIFQDKFYLFLRQMLNRWPLDHNFILIVEMWLSFIQPWRYDNCKPAESGELDLDHQCRSFMTENLLAYTQIFHQILARIERLDLVIFKNAAMLYRVAKVLSRTPIPNILYDIELTLNSTSPFSSPVAGTSTGSPRSNSIFDSSCRTPIVHDIIKQRIAQLEGADYKYHNMFDQSVIYQVTKLLKHMQECIILSKKNVDILESTLQARKKGFINMIKYYLELTETTDLEQSIIERKKVPGYLEISSQYLCQIFNLDYEELMHRINEQLHTNPPFIPSANSSFNTSGSNTLYGSETCQSLNSTQIKEHARNLSYMGDPDVIPVSSQEIEFLVVKLNKFSKAVNFSYGEQLKKLWYNEALIGKVSRQILMPPMIAKGYVKTNQDYSTLQSTFLPPRLSLRFLAQTRLWIFSSLFMLFGSFLGYPLILSALCLLFIFCIYILIRATFYDPEILTEGELIRRSTIPKVKLSFSI